MTGDNGDLDSESALVRRCAEGDRDALAALYATHATLVYRTAYAIMGSAADSEDVLQDVFVGLPRAARSFLGRGSFGGWLRRVAATTALMSMRRRREGDSAGLADLHEAGASDLDAAIDLKQSIDRLAVRHRQVFLLKEVEGYSHEEIASLLGISAGASMTCLHRAKRALCTSLDGR